MYGDAFYSLPAISGFEHPDYMLMWPKWHKYRKVAEGGHDFVSYCLQPFSTKETVESLAIRKQISYCSAHSKSAITDIKNAIYQRMVDIKRIGGSKSYQDATRGEISSVDMQGNSMNSFIGCKVIFELLTMGKIGVYVDREAGDIVSLQDTKTNIPYLYTYKVEDILNWQFDRQGRLSAVVLRDCRYTSDDDGFPNGIETCYRILRSTPSGITVQVWNDDKTLLEEKILGIKTIPFTIFQLTTSLLTDIADHQIALTNLASADINYSIKANFPFLTEQYMPYAEMPALKKIDPETGEEITASSAAVGIEHGRRYPKGVDRPDFIHPSPEPLLASMKKQEDIKREIRQLVNLALTSIEPRRESADSKKEDRVGKEEGLSYIGLELEHGEREISRIWAEYEGEQAATIKYPNNYSLRTDDDRRQEAKELTDLLPKIPSVTYQKELAKNIISVSIEHRVSTEKLQQMLNEVDRAKVIVIDPDVLAKDFENGFIGVKLGSEARGYPPGESEQAAKDHAERATRIALAQSAATYNPAARGVTDMSASPTQQAKEEKNGTT